MGKRVCYSSPVNLSGGSVLAAKRFLKIIFLAALAAMVLPAAQDRILGPIDPTRLTNAPGRPHPLARAEYDRGPADDAMPLPYVTLYLKTDPSLGSFLDELQMPSSPNYHKWITPEQFGARFGASPGDITKVVHWLESVGLKVNDIARGSHWVTFSGTAGSVGRALHTSFRHYEVDGKTHFAYALQPQIPVSIEPIAAGFAGLDDFNPEPLIIRAPVQPQSLGPDYNSGASHYIAPDDFATIYNVSPLYGAGLDGTGQKIAILGDSAVDLNDIRAFRKFFGLAANDPQVVLFGPDPGKNGAQTEADLDLEWSGAVARNATIIFVYAQNVNTAAQYAVDQNLAPVMSVSFGGCEQYDSPILRGVAQQANAQGITWFASSGDTGATNCDRFSLIAEATKGLTVNFPASIPEITAVGGTAFDDSAGGFWGSRNSATNASALSYIPERAWNDSRTSFSSSGGGASKYFNKPWWQNGPGVPDDGARDLPDISLAASPSKYAYLIQSGGILMAVGGTSASSPSFAGIAALLNQHLANQGAPSGLGNINPSLYRLAQSTTDVFHDILNGDNQEPCAQGSPACVNGLAGYPAGSGYDMATGLGSVNANNLVMEWASGTASSTTLTAVPSTAGLTDKVTLTATVTASNGGASPTGNVDFVVSGVNLGTASLTANGSIASASISTTGSALVVGNGGNAQPSALYGGGGNLTASAGSASVTIQPPASTGSYIVPYVNPNPTPEIAGGWPYTVGLTEIAGVETRLTKFTVDGVTQNLNLWTTTAIPAHGAASASLAASLNSPTNRTFVFTGSDDDGRSWTQQLVVPFTGSASSFGPALSLTNRAGSSVAYDPQADPSCRWFIPLTLQEKGGYYVQITQLRANQTDVTAQVQSIFGTARLAPFSTLEGNLCFSAAGTGPIAVTVTGAVEDGSLSGTEPAALSVSAVFPTPIANPAPMSASPQAVALSTSDSAASVSLSFAGTSTTAWTASISQGNSLASWLTVSPTSGSGAATIALHASAAGLSPGAYNATVWIYASGATPPLLGVPVTFVVGASPDIAIAGLQNAFSFQSVFAPGMAMTVYGTNLANATQFATRLPLPLTMQGVTATVNGVAAPISYASPSQLNIQVPYETGAGPAVLAVNRGGQVASYIFMVTMTAPGVFPSAIDNATGLPVSSAVPGNVLLLFMTGDGDVTPFLTTGATPSSTITNVAQLPKPRLPVAVTVGGVPAQVLFAGIPSGLAGVTQIDIIAPSNVPAGEQDLVVSVGGIPAPAIKLTVTPPSQQ